MRKAIFAAIICFGVSGLASAQDAPAPCGPAGHLSDGLSTNVAADSRCFEIRMYTADTERSDGWFSRRFAQTLPHIAFDRFSGPYSRPTPIASTWTARAVTSTLRRWEFCMSR